MYRLVTLDIDGTVLDSRGEIRPRVLAAVGRAIQAGVAVTLATEPRWRAARDIALRLGIRVPVINWNDMEMIDFAGLGVAMANGVPELRQRADLVTASNDEDGVAAVLERYVLGEVA